MDEPSNARPPQPRPLILGGARIVASDLRARILRPGAHVSEIRVEQARISGALDLSGVRVEIPLSFRDCEFDGPLAAAGAAVKRLELLSCRCVSIDAAGLRGERLDLGATRIDSSLSLHGAAFKEVLAVDVRTGASVDCGELSAGRLGFARAEIGAELDLEEARLDRGADLSGVQADTIVLAALEGRRVDLSGARVRLLRDPSGDYALTLRGFVFRELDPLDGAASRLAWLERADGADLETYRLLASALRRAGEEAEADWVLARGVRRTQRRSRGPNDLLRVPSDPQAGRESVTGLLPSLVALVGLSAVVYGANAVLPRLDNLAPPEVPLTWSAFVGWLGLVTVVLTAVYALLPLIRGGLLFTGGFWLPRARLSVIPAIALLDAADRIDRRYGLDARYGWPRLAALLPADARRVVEDTQRRLDALVAAPPGFIGAAGVSALFAPYFSSIPALWVAPASMLVLALVTLARAGAAAVDHGRAVEAAVDLHRFRLLEALHVELPANATREREVFERVSLSFIQAEPYRGAYLHPSQATAGLDDVERTLESVLTEKLTEAIDGPPLVNFEGSLSVRVIPKGGGTPLPLAEKRVYLTPGRDYAVEATIGRDALPGSLSDEIAIVNGIDSDEVPFDVRLDADTLVLTALDRPVTVRHGAAATVSFDVRLEPGERDRSVWVRVSQVGRPAQIVALRLLPEETSA